MDFTVFQYVGNSVKSATDTFLMPATTHMIAAIQSLAMVGVTLYMTLMGYAIATGAIESPLWVFIKQCTKITVIACFAMTVDGYVQGVMNTLTGLETGLLDALGLSSPEGVSLYQTLDGALGKGMEQAAGCVQKAHAAGWHIGSAISWLVAAGCVAMGTVLVAMIGGANIIVAKFALSLLLALGPLFLLCLMFPITARFFDSWFSQVMNYVLTIVLLAAVMLFAVKTYDVFLSGADFSGNGDKNPLIIAMQVGALSGVLMWISFQTSSIASGLAGGLSLAAMGLRHIMQPAALALNGAKGVYNLINGQSTRRDLQSGHMVTAGRTNHLIAGNTILNPAYRQHVMQQMGKNWGRAKGGTVKPG